MARSCPATVRRLAGYRQQCVAEVTPMECIRDALHSFGDEGRSAVVAHALREGASSVFVRRMCGEATEAMIETTASIRSFSASPHSTQLHYGGRGHGGMWPHDIGTCAGVSQGHYPSSSRVAPVVSSAREGQAGMPNAGTWERPGMKTWRALPVVPPA